MAQDREKISTGRNERPVDETIAGTGPGIPDEALTPARTSFQCRLPTSKSKKQPKILALPSARWIRFRSTANS